MRWLQGVCLVVAITAASCVSNPTPHPGTTDPLATGGGDRGGAFTAAQDPDPTLDDDKANNPMMGGGEATDGLADAAGGADTVTDTDSPTDGDSTASSDAGGSDEADVDSHNSTASSGDTSPEEKDVDDHN